MPQHVISYQYRCTCAFPILPILPFGSCRHQVICIDYPCNFFDPCPDDLSPIISKTICGSFVNSHANITESSLYNFPLNVFPRVRTVPGKVTGKQDRWKDRNRSETRRAQRLWSRVWNGGCVESHQDAYCAKPPDYCQKFERILSLGKRKWKS